MIKLIVGLLAILAVRAQTLEMPSASVDRGSANIFRIVLKTQAQRPITALQLELVIPPGLRVAGDGIVPGDAAEAAGKSVSCSNPTETKNGTVFVCIFAGGFKPIQTGTLAIVRFSAASDSRAGTVSLGLRNILGVSADLRKIQLADTSSAITIR